MSKWEGRDELPSCQAAKEEHLDALRMLLGVPDDATREEMIGVAQSIGDGTTQSTTYSGWSDEKKYTYTVEDHEYRLTLIDNEIDRTYETTVSGDEPLSEQIRDDQCCIEIQSDEWNDDMDEDLRTMHSIRGLEAVVSEETDDGKVVFSGVVKALGPQGVEWRIRGSEVNHGGAY